MREFEVKKINVRYRYPWKQLLELGDYFIISEENESGMKNIRQLCYAVTKASIRKGPYKKFKHTKQLEGGLKVELLEIETATESLTD